MDLFQTLNMLFKHKRKIVTVFLVVVATVTTTTLLMKPVYQAKSTILVKMLKEDTSRPGIGSEDDRLPLNLSQDEVINTEVQIMDDRGLAEKVLNTLQVAKVYPAIARQSQNQALVMEQAVLAFQKSLKVFGVRKSNVITITFEHNDPKLAASAVNLLVDAFESKHLELHSDPRSDFIGNQLAGLKEKLGKSQKELQEYQQKHDAFSLEEQRSLLLNQKVQFDSSYKVAAASIGELRRTIGALRGTRERLNRSEDHYTSTDRDKIIADAKSKLLELEIQEHELKRKYTDKNRFLMDVRNEKATVTQFLKEQEASISSKVKTGNPIYQSVEMDLYKAQAELGAQEAKAGALREQLARIDAQIAALDNSESRVQNLKRGVAIDEKNYMTYAAKYEEARISNAMNIMKLSNISVIQAAEVPVKPIKPKKKLYMLIGLLFGAIAGIAAALISENLGQTFSDPESVEEYLELPVLATVPVKEEE